jgi:hypothetical protein
MDSGKHWFRTRRVGTSALEAGGRVFWTLRGSLYRVVHWPMLAVAREICRSYTRRGACTLPRFVEAGTRSALLLRLDDATFAEDTARLADGFVVPLLNTRSGLPQRAVVVHELGVHVVDLPDVGWTVCGTVKANRFRIAVDGCASQAGRPLGQWVSVDGGATWSIVG